MSDAKQIVLAFWQAMQSNDFEAASLHLTEDFEGYWPQSGELTVGRANFAAINTHYPGQGEWQFTLHSIVAEGDQVVTDVTVTDGELEARAITFHTVLNGKIHRQTEYWPDPMPALEWRRQWVRLVD